MAAATYEQRAVFGANVAFVRRVQTTVIKGAVTVATEDPATPDHDMRNKLAGWSVREPENAARRFAQLMASLIPVDDDGTGTLSTSYTDANLQTWVETHWTAIAKTVVMV